MIPLNISCFFRLFAIAVLSLDVGKAEKLEEIYLGKFIYPNSRVVESDFHLYDKNHIALAITQAIASCGCAKVRLSGEKGSENCVKISVDIQGINGRRDFDVAFVTKNGGLIRKRFFLSVERNFLLSPNQFVHYVLDDKKVISQKFTFLNFDPSVRKEQLSVKFSPEHISGFQFSLTELKYKKSLGNYKPLWVADLEFKVVDLKASQSGSYVRGSLSFYNGDVLLSSQKILVVGK